jgi:hypothetical protein
MDQSLPLNAELPNTWSYTATPLIRFNVLMFKLRVTYFLHLKRTVAILWNMKQCSVVEVQRRFGVTYCFLHQGQRVNKAIIS